MVRVAATCIAVAGVIAGPSAAATTTPAAGGGHVYGGVTPQNWPIVVDLDKAQAVVTRIVIGLDMTCTSNENFGTTDGFTDVRINSKNRFKATFGPQRIDAAGTPADIEGRITGRRSRDRRSIKGTWNYKVTFYDAAGTTVTDTCDSGLVSWKASQ
ncbi:MAG: hypothetical protein QOE11_2570 [Solirubrobacteraceae bacterium]|jgi:hypothetical protein|nr:hypothetical protein [Solirubrobacteraceae bacterium]